VVDAGPDEPVQDPEATVSGSTTTSRCASMLDRDIHRAIDIRDPELSRHDVADHRRGSEVSLSARNSACCSRLSSTPAGDA
jgi:hypothetical protein